MELHSDGACDSSAGVRSRGAVEADVVEQKDNSAGEVVPRACSCKAEADPFVDDRDNEKEIARPLA